MAFHLPTKSLTSRSEVVVLVYGVCVSGEGGGGQYWVAILVHTTLYVRCVNHCSTESGY